MSFEFYNDSKPLGYTEEVSYRNGIAGQIADIILDIGDIATLNTDVKTSLVAALNLVNSYTGSLSNLTTTAKDNIVNSLNELKNDINDIISGEVTDGSITDSKLDPNGIKLSVTNILTNIGTLAELPTTDKTNLVNSLKEIDSELTDSQTKITDIMTYKRFFKPKLAMFMDLIPGGYGYAELTHAQMDTQLDKMLARGVKSLIIQPWVYWNNGTNTLSMLNTTSNLIYLANSAISKGMKISCLKIHFYGMNDTNLPNLTSDQLTTFKTQHKTIVTNLVSAFNGIELGYVVVLNECSFFYKTGSAHVAWTNDLIDTVQAMNRKVGISTMGAKETVLMDSTIASNVDAFFTNCYPRMSFKMEKTTYDDTKSAWNGSYEIKMLKQIKANYPTKPLIMSETGCNDFWIALANPGDSSLGYSTVPSTKTGGYASACMLSGLFNLSNEIQQSLEEVWWCYESSIYNDICGNLIKKYTGGDY